MKERTMNPGSRYSARLLTARPIMSATATILFAAGALLAGAPPAGAQGVAPPPLPPAPAPGSPAKYVTATQIATALQAAIAKPSDPATSPVDVTDQYSINVLHRAKPTDPAIHPAATELHYILEGSGTFVTGGTITTSSGGGGKIIEGGVSRKVQKGDAILIPANTPHWYQQIDGSLSYLEVRFKN